jgi:hypothetical protein
MDKIQVIMKERKCKHCQEKFQPKKRDQKFCSASCRVTHHQKKKLKAYKVNGYIEWVSSSAFFILAVLVVLFVLLYHLPNDRAQKEKIYQYEWILDSLGVDYQNKAF